MQPSIQTTESLQNKVGRKNTKQHNRTRKNNKNTPQQMWGRGRKPTTQSVNSKRRTKQWENTLELTASVGKPESISPPTMPSR